MGNSEYSAYRRRGRRGSRPSVLPPVASDERTVLIVEADPDVQVQMARALRALGHRVVGTSSGGGARALISQWCVDMILVSENLPGQAGIDVAHQLHCALPSAKVVVVANHVEPNVFAAARAAGAVGCVAKPLDPETLLRWLPPANNVLPASEAVAE